MTKADLRRIMITQRNLMHYSEVTHRSFHILRNLMRLPRILTSNTIMIYLAHGNEVNTWPQITHWLREGRNILVPKMFGNELKPVLIKNLDDLVINQIGIPEPANNDDFVDHIPITIIPGLAFGRSGERLGRGKGHYDRFLTTHPQTIRIGLAYDWQILQDIPQETHDQTMDLIVTETNILVPSLHRPRI